MNVQIEWKGGVPEPLASIYGAMAGDGEALLRAARLLWADDVVDGIIADSNKKIEEVASPGAGIAGQTSPHRVANPEAIVTIAGALKRIADYYDPPPPDVVDSVYIAKKLDCTTTWVAEMARNGDIPAACIVPGTGNGKPWKFYRSKIEKWLEER